MTIKQQGGIFGRNPTFNEVDVETITGVSGVFTQDLGVGTSSPSAPFVTSNNGAEGYEIAPATAVGGTVRAISFNRSTISYIPFRQQASEHQFYNASTQIAKLTSTGNLEVNVGNLVIGTSGKGIDFSATSGTGTSELFSDYEEGTWTVTTNGDATGAFSAQSGKYVKVGNIVHIYCAFDVSANFTSPSIGGLPYAVSPNPAISGGYGAGMALTSTGYENFNVNNAETIFFASNPDTTKNVYRLAFTYISE